MSVDYNYSDGMDMSIYYLQRYSKDLIDYTDRRIKSLYMLIDNYNYSKKKHTEHVMSPFNINRRRHAAHQVLNDIKGVHDDIQKVIFNVEQYKNILDNMDSILPRAETLKARALTLDGLALNRIEEYNIPASDHHASLVIDAIREKYNKAKTTGGKTKKRGAKPPYDPHKRGKIKGKNKRRTHGKKSRE